MTNRTRTYTWKAPIQTWDERHQTNGMHYLQSILDGQNVSSPMMQTLGISLQAIDDGYAVYTVEPAEYHYNPIGVVHGGLAASLFDTALSSAIITRLPAGKICATVQLNVHYLRAMTTETGQVRCEAHAIHVGRMIATAEGKIIGENDGKVYGHATISCVVMSAPQGALTLPRTEDTRTFSWSDPLDGARMAMTMDGLTYLQKIQTGDIPPPPIANIMGMTGIQTLEAGNVRFATDIGAWQMNTAGVIHGGLTTTLCDSALGCAVHSVIPQGMAYTTSELNIYFVRPVTTDIPALYADATVLHQGSRVATAEARVVDDDGTLYAHATTACLIFPIH